MEVPENIAKAQKDRRNTRESCPQGLNRLRKNSESTSSPPAWTGAPCSPSVHGLNTTGEALQCFLSMNHTVTDAVKAFEKCHFRPMYAGRTWGTRPGRECHFLIGTASDSVGAPKIVAAKQWRRPVLFLG